MHAAACAEQVETVRYLLSKGANKNIRDLDNETAEENVLENCIGPPETFPRALAAKKRRMQILKMLQ